jgi:hypothetical protein
MIFRNTTSVPVITRVAAPTMGVEVVLQMIRPDEGALPR